MLTISVFETRWLLSTSNPARSGITGSPPRSSGTDTVSANVSSIPMWSASTLASAASWPWTGATKKTVNIAATSSRSLWTK